MAVKQITFGIPYRIDLFLSLLQLLFALLFCAIYVVFMTSFQGEFLIIVKGLWILPIFILFLLGGSIYSTVTAIKSRRSQELKGILSDKIQNPSLRKMWLFGWAIWNLIASLPILLVGKVLALGALYDPDRNLFDLTQREQPPEERKPLKPYYINRINLPGSSELPGRSWCTS